MALSAFDDRAHPPGEDELRAVLGTSAARWSDLIEHVTSKFPPGSAEWGYSGRSTGWGLRVKQKDRIILYMTPCRDYFLASFVLGEKAVQAVHRSDLPAQVAAMIDGAKRYAEGRGVRLEVRTAHDVAVIETLAEIKAAS
jgi:hypothetical protein